MSSETPISYLPETFYPELRKTDNYGVYELFARTNDKYKLCKGQGKFEMIEMSQQIINDTRKRLQLCVSTTIYLESLILYILLIVQ